MKTLLLTSLTLLTVLQWSGCASTSQDRYEKLASAENCLSGTDRLDFSKAPGLSAKAVEGELSDEKCLMLGGVRTAYAIYRIKAGQPEHDLDVRVSPKAAGFGYGGQHTLIVPVVSIVEKGVARPAAQGAYLREKNVWTGDTHHFGFKLQGLVPGQVYSVLVTSDNSQPGSRLTKESMPNYGGGAIGAMTEIDTSLFMGPFGDFEIRVGRYTAK